jgi:GDP-L-fucose synthase
VSDFWRSRRVVVTGGAGFIGSAVCRALVERGAGFVGVPRSRAYDLTTRVGAARMLAEFRPDVLIHAAGVGGGIAAHRAEPGRHFYANTIMALHTVEEARACGVEKIVYVGSADSYSPSAPVPVREDDLWEGDLEPSSRDYALAKKVPIVMLDGYRAQYGMRAAAVILTNVYGPGASFDVEKSHVVPAMIRRFDDAARRGETTVTCWGSGRPTRDFLYVDDAAEGIVLAAEKLDEPSPVNLAAGEETTIAELARTVASLCGFRGAIAWDTSKPDGHPRRVLDVTRAHAVLGFRARTPLADGLRATIEWWRSRGRNG